MGAEHLQADQAPAKPAVYCGGYNVSITISTPQPPLCRVQIITQKQSFFTDVALASHDNFIGKQGLLSPFSHEESGVPSRAVASPKAK